MDNHKIATELVDMAERIAQEAVDVYMIPRFGLVMGTYNIVFVRKGQSPDTDRRTQGEPEYLGTAPSLEDAEDVVAGVAYRPGGLDKIKKALKRLKASDMSERIAANKTLSVYDGEDEELTYDLEAALSYFLDGSSTSNGTDIIFYEEETRKGEPVRIEVDVTTRYHPKTLVVVGLYIAGPNGAAYGAGEWKFRITDTVKEVAKTIGQAAQKVLKKF